MHCTRINQLCMIHPGLSKCFIFVLNKNHCSSCTFITGCLSRLKQKSQTKMFRGRVHFMFTSCLDLITLCAAGTVSVWVRIKLWFQLWFWGPAQDTEESILPNERSTREKPSTQPEAGLPQSAGTPHHTTHVHLLIHNVFC